MYNGTAIKYIQAEVIPGRHCHCARSLSSTIPLIAVLRHHSSSKRRTISAPKRLNPRNLPRRELRIASVTRIVHVIMNRVHSSLCRTTILRRLSRTSIGTRTLHRSVTDQIPVTITRVTFKSMKESKPMSCFMNGCHAHVVACHGTAGHSIGVDVAAVGVVFCRQCLSCDLRWQCACS